MCFGCLGAFRAGIGVLAKTLNIPVVPIRLDGLHELRVAGKKLAKPGTARGRIGEPHRFEPAAEPEAIARRLQQVVEIMGERFPERI